MNKRAFYFNNSNLKNRRRELRRKQTQAEILMWNCLRNNKLGVRFRRQYSMGNYVLDFYCSKKRLGIELDGGQHANKENVEYDVYRTRFLEAFGVEVLRFWNKDVLTKMEELLEVISTKLVNK